MVARAPVERGWAALQQERWEAAREQFESERTAALDRDFLELVTRLNRGPADGPVEYRYGYLLALARKRT